MAYRTNAAQRAYLGDFEPTIPEPTQRFSDDMISQCCGAQPVGGECDPNANTGRCSACQELTVFERESAADGDPDAGKFCTNCGVDLDTFNNPGGESEFCIACEEGR